MKYYGIVIALVAADKQVVSGGTRGVKENQNHIPDWYLVTHDVWVNQQSNIILGSLFWRWWYHRTCPELIWETFKETHLLQYYFQTFCDTFNSNPVAAEVPSLFLSSATLRGLSCTEMMVPVSTFLVFISIGDTPSTYSPNYYYYFCVTKWDLILRRDSRRINIENRIKKFTWKRDDSP